MLGIAVLTAMFGVYVVANIWARPRGSRRKHTWIEECDLDETVDDLANANAPVFTYAEEPADHGHGGHDHGGHDHHFDFFGGDHH